MTGISNDEISFPHKLLLTDDPQVLKIGKPYPNGSSVNIKLPKS